MHNFWYLWKEPVEYIPANRAVFTFLSMTSCNILVISDMQNGFLRRDGNLYIQDADQIIEPTNQFFLRITPIRYDLTIIILDTHFSEEYDQSPEGSLFPLHCDYGTWDWEPAVNTALLPEAIFFFKNTFNMWDNLTQEQANCSTPERARAHQALFHFVTNPNTCSERVPRDRFLSDRISNGEHTGMNVTLIGVASDYCNRFVMEGWLNRGARVTIITDLTRGIDQETPQVLSEPQYIPFLTDQLRAVSMDQYIREIHQNLKE